MKRRNRQKKCATCQQSAPVLYRIRSAPEQTWQFVCGSCWPGLSQNNPNYRYGGTWKAKKRK